MKRMIRITGICFIALSISLASACGSTNQGQTQQQSIKANQKQAKPNNNQSGAEVKGKSQRNERVLEHDGRSNQRRMNAMQTPQDASTIRQQQNETSGDQVEVIEIDGKVFAPLVPLMRKAGFRHVEMDEQSGTYQIGDHDIVYVLRGDSKQAIKEEQGIELTDTIRKVNGQPYISVESLHQLFGNEIKAKWDGRDRIHLQRAPDLLPNDIVEDLDFADDPAEAGKEVWSPYDTQVFDAEAEPVLKNINIDSMIQEARKYLGVKYKFGAKPYSSKNKRFDCSSYTRYIFGKYGVELPRTARAQAKKGTTVSRKSLKKGDLLYFYVPGRFKNNKTIGHVGIYMGNQRMIHSSPEPENGVQITNINKSYWKETFVTAKRIVK